MHSDFTDNNDVFISLLKNYFKKKHLKQIENYFIYQLFIDFFYSFFLKINAVVF